MMVLIPLLATFCDVRLPAALSDHCVLQRERPAAIWGNADAGEKIAITGSWAPESPVETTAGADGRFRAELPAPSAAGPFEITVRGKNTVTIADVLFGEVWLCSGQSNMEKQVGPMAGQLPCDDWESVCKAANHPTLRMFTVRRAKSPTPLETCEGRWEVASPKTVARFSATAYFFGLDLLQSLKVPVGLIHSSWGGTEVELWMSAEGIASVPALAERAADPAKQRAALAAALARWEESAAALDPVAKEAALPATPDAEWRALGAPGEWTESGLGDFDGVVWARRHVTLTAAWASRSAMLELGPIDDDDVTYVNGVRVGATEGWDAPRRYLVPGDLLREGDNVIAVRILDTGGQGGFHGGRGALELRPSTKEGEAPLEIVSLAGSWKYHKSVEMSKLPQRPQSSVREHSTLYNAMIAPWRGTPIRGAIWYQGESNTGRAEQYAESFPAMIADWRAKLASPRLDFYFVQIAPYTGYGPAPIAAELRESQRLTLSVPHTGMAVTTDLASDPTDIHPTQKREVGARLARWALSHTYEKKDVVPSGPLYRAHKVEGSSVRIEFEHADGLVVRGGALAEFTIAGEDGVFVEASAVIDASTVVVSSPKVPAPVAVRFAWSNSPRPNLFNGAGLPASPFRTDRFPLSTAGRRW